ncbi:accessory gene regulator B family protein [Lacrimispora sp. 38-1]|uniref:accessory gene regulator B family protein n=1 Tax=Lacrimispora sp. 38-1 TaxID=3125778 RepID=UPI003CF62713
MALFGGDKVIISKFSASLCCLLNKINPRDEDDNITIQYGVELILDNLLKLLFIQLLGILLGKGVETFIVLFVFCTLRLQAGGIHAKTNMGCFLGMLLIWFLSLSGAVTFKLNLLNVMAIYMFSLTVFVCMVPKSKNITYFTRSAILKKKTTSILLLSLLVLIAVYNENLRELIIYPVALEVLTLLPPNKDVMKGDFKNEEENC